MSIIEKDSIKIAIENKEIKSITSNQEMNVVLVVTKNKKEYVNTFASFSVMVEQLDISDLVDGNYNLKNEATDAIVGKFEIKQGNLETIDSFVDNLLVVVNNKDHDIAVYSSLKNLVLDSNDFEQLADGEYFINLT